MTRIFENVDALKDVVGTELGTSEWLTIDQDRINMFAEATGDHQWIHVDPERAATGPFGTTVAHGYLTFSLLAPFTDEIFQVEGLKFGLNYGANKLRFPSPVPVDSRLRATATLLEANDIAIGTQFVIKVVVEREGGDKPSCIAEVVYVMA